MKISVVVTCYNRKYEVRRALESIYLQTYRPDEIILIDDGNYEECELKESTDCNMNLFRPRDVKEYLDKYNFENLQYYRTGHVGPGAARNYGIKKAHGNYVAFLDSDNEWDKDKLEKVIDIAERCPEADIVSCHYKYYEEFAWKIKPHTVPANLRHTIQQNDEDVMWVYEIPSERILVQNVADASASIYKRDFLTRIGGFSEQMTTNIDWEILLRARKRARNENWNFRIILLDMALSDNHTMFDSLSENIELELNERLELFKENEEEIFEKGLELEYYNQFILDKNVRMRKQHAVEQLFRAAKYDERLILPILQKQQDDVDKLQIRLNRKSKFYDLLFTWVSMKQSGGSVADKLEEKGISTIGIYGAGRHGKLLYQELCNSSIKVQFFIDRNTDNIKFSEVLPVLSLDDTWPQVDAVVVSTYLEIDSIRLSIEKKGIINVIPLNEIVG